MNPIIASVVIGAILGFIVGATASLIHNYNMRKRFNQQRMWNELRRK